MGRIQCDFEAVLDRVGGDRELLAQIAQVVLADLDGLLESLQQALDQGDAAETRKRAHRLKGAVGNFEVQPIFDLALSIELAGDENRLADARAAWETLSGYIDELREFLTGIAEPK